jgi:hypothetical protein
VIGFDGLPLLLAHPVRAPLPSPAVRQPSHAEHASRSSVSGFFPASMQRRRSSPSVDRQGRATVALQSCRREAEFLPCLCCSNRTQDRVGMSLREETGGRSLEPRVKPYCSRSNPTARGSDRRPTAGWWTTGESKAGQGPVEGVEEHGWVRGFVGSVTATRQGLGIPSAVWC